ncbi:MarR family winged helix-turn-helix transcriptional regulator [Paenibacillus sp. S28]|uniref:MarR family winged helix-turn-helix transcriptional regulator n=1 Tax=Paenibacillus sp. S28 TaxID=2767463 RepID=UPI00190B9E9E|nr:MarR family transcriptional regulator [Paenibacillus sp. S28]MBJ9987622.1 MarR family transcriptional regulator [Paenibacillus sp. S28]
MKNKHVSKELDIADFVKVIESLTRINIRLPSIDKLSFTTLSVLHTLTLSSPMRLTELTATEQVTQSAITQIVTRLERDGLVERRSDPNDGRVVLVHITPQGANVIDSRRLERISRIAGFAENLTREESQAIADAIPALRRLVEIAGDA